MIELITISRFIIDYFWEYKLLNILHVFVVGVAFLFLTLAGKKFYFRACKVDKIFFAFTLFGVFVFLKNVNDDTAIEFLKFVTYLFFYLVGRILPSNLQYGKHIGFFAIAMLVFYFFLAMTDQGYQTWGSVSTFTGGYYFKTDLAISSLMLLVFICVSLRNRILLFLSVTLVGYLVFKSNARIALPFILIIPLVVFFALKGKLVEINIRAVAIFLAISGLGMSLFALVDFNSLGLLGFDFSDPYSEGNTQGRSVIWSAILQSYANASFFEQFTGLGFYADAKATSLFSDNLELEGFRAHNSYLLLLICMGVIGSLIFYSVLILIISKIPMVLRHGSYAMVRVAIILICFLIIFFAFSVSTEIVIRPQLMVFLFLYSGLHTSNFLSLQRRG